MALTKADIVQSFVDETGFTKNKAAETVETLIEII